MPIYYILNARLNIAPLFIKVSLYIFTSCAYSEYCENLVATFNRDASRLTLCPDWHLHQEQDLIQWEVLCQEVFYSRSWGCPTITMSGVLANNVTTYTSMICSHEEGVLTIDQQFKHTSPQKLWERMMMVKENKGGSSSCLHTILSVSTSYLQ